MRDGKVKVLYIAGNGRSGSTILDIILGQLEGFFAVGELRRIWDRGLIENRVCGCSAPFRDCPTWTAIFREAYGGMDAVDPGAMVNYRERMTQTKHLPSMLLRKKVGQSGSPELQSFLAALDRLYSSIPRVTGCDVIVDSSKWPMYGYMLDLLPSVELYVLHLIRDPRAVAFSWTRNKYYEQDRMLPRQSALKSTAYWLAWNPAITYFWDRPPRRYLFLPYEHFVSEPRSTLEEVARFVGQNGEGLPFIDGLTMDLGRTHAIAGNIARLTQGRVTLAVDDEWKRNMPWISKLLVSTLTWPFLYRYGYFGQPTETLSGRAPTVSEGWPGNDGR